MTTAARPPQPSARRRWIRPAVVLGWVAALLVADLALGLLLDASGLIAGERGLLLAVQEEGVHTMMSAPPIVDEPWAEQYAEELLDYQVREPHYEPFLVDGPYEFHGELINTTDRERVSYQAVVPAGVEPLRIAFFGASTIFGMGQRDDHTIVSAFARTAEAAGVPVEVHAYGFPAWVTWQEFLYLERIVAEGERFDQIVFYDGFNDFEVQGAGLSAHPTHVGALTIQEIASAFQREQEAPPGTFDGLSDLWRTYRENSAVAGVIDELGGGPDTFGATDATVDPQAQADAALDIYARTVDRISALARREGTPVTFFWQPRQMGWPREVIDRLPTVVTDISPVFDGQQPEIYIDPIHTTEEGARLVAEAMWTELAPALEAMAGSPATGAG